MKFHHVTWCSFAAAPIWRTHFVWRAPLALFLLYLNFFPTVNSMTHTLLKTSPRYLMQLRCCTLCDAQTLCGELRSLFFYCTLNSFPTVNSLPTVNSVTHALRLRPMWRTHYVWWAPLNLFLLYHELFSDHELFTNRKFHDARTLAPPHVMHSLRVASSACSFSIVPWTLLQPWTLYRPWAPWCTHCRKLRHVSWRRGHFAPPP